MKLLFATILLSILTSCSWNKGVNSKNGISLPSVTVLDSLSNANSDQLYYWTEESLASEESVLNNQDLDIKVNRKVEWTFQNEKYVLYPFFRKNSSNSKIAFLHLLLTKSKMSLDRLENVGFDNLHVISSEKAYYYYEL